MSVYPLFIPWQIARIRLIHAFITLMTMSSVASMMVIALTWVVPPWWWQRWHGSSPGWFRAEDLLACRFPAGVKSQSSCIAISLLTNQTAQDSIDSIRRHKKAKSKKLFWGRDEGLVYVNQAAQIRILTQVGLRDWRNQLHFPCLIMRHHFLFLVLVAKQEIDRQIFIQISREKLTY